MEKKSFHLPYGLITGLVIVIMAAIFHVTDVPPKSSIQYTMYIPFITGVILACVNYAKQMNNYVTFGNVFSTGFKTTAVVTIVVLIWVILTFFIFPEMKDVYQELSIAQMEKQNASEKQISEAVEAMGKFYYVIMIGATVFNNMVTGVIFSLIGAAVVKKKGKKPLHLQD